MLCRIIAQGPAGYYYIGAATSAGTEEVKVQSGAVILGSYIILIPNIE